MIIHKKSSTDLSISKKYLPKYDYTESYGVCFKSSQKIDSKKIFSAFFSTTPFWIVALMYVRNRLLKPFDLTSLKIDDPRKIAKNFDFKNRKKFANFFEIYHTDKNKIVFGAQDKHLDFCMSLEYTKDKNSQTIIFSNLIYFRNIFGKIYFYSSIFLHTQVVKSMLKATACEILATKKTNIST